MAICASVEPVLASSPLNSLMMAFLVSIVSFSIMSYKRTAKITY